VLVRVCSSSGLGVFDVDGSVALERGSVSEGSTVGLYTILPLPILYGVWHRKGGAEGVHVLRISM